MLVVVVVVVVVLVYSRYSSKSVFVVLPLQKLFSVPGFYQSLR